MTQHNKSEMNTLLSVITESAKEPVVGLWQRVKQPIEDFGWWGLFIALFAISIYYFITRLIITTVNSNTDRILKEVGLGNSPKLLYDTYLFARLDEEGDIIPVCASNIEVETPETIKLKQTGIYFVSYHLTSSSVIDGAYVEIDSDEIAQSNKQNSKNTISGGELFITSEPNEIITFNIIGTPRNASGKFKIIYFGNI